MAAAAVVTVVRMKTKLEYHENLDGLRGISALMIVVFHFYTIKGGFYADVYWAPDNWFWRQVTQSLQHGVSLFFVLSGFLITRILLHAKGERHYFQTFYIRRILRIAPLYYLFLLVWFYVLPILLHTPVVPFRDQVPSFLYLQNIYTTFSIPQAGPLHFWSLAIEEHFYLAWPLVVFFMPKSKLGTIIGCCIGGVLVVNFVMISNGYDTHDFTLTRIDQILLGALLCTWERSETLKSLKSRYGCPVILLLIPVAAAVYYFITPVTLLREMLKYTTVGVIFYILIAYILTIDRDSPANKVLTNGPLQYFGRISYGIYVWHPFVLILLYRYFVTGVIELDLILVMVFTIVVAHLSYFYYETIFLNMKDKIQQLLVRRVLAHHRHLSRTRRQSYHRLAHH